MRACLGRMDRSGMTYLQIVIPPRFRRGRPFAPALRYSALSRPRAGTVSNSAPGTVPARGRDKVMKPTRPTAWPGGRGRVVPRTFPAIARLRAGGASRKARAETHHATCQFWGRMRSIWAWFPECAPTNNDKAPCPRHKDIRGTERGTLGCFPIRVRGAGPTISTTAYDDSHRARR